MKIEDIKLHFIRSILVAKKIGILLIEDYIKTTDSKELVNGKNFSSYALNRLDYGNQEELIKELLSFEYKRLNLGDNAEKIKKINLQEIALNKERERFLFMNIKRIKNSFVTNSYVQLYKSNYKIVLNNDNILTNFKINNLKKSKNNFYFLFQRIGIFDKGSKSNILEFSITKYEYFVLKLFETPITILMAQNKFLDIFIYDNHEESKQIEDVFFKILKELIYKKHVIKHY